MREIVKSIALAAATIAALPALASFAIRRAIFGADRAIEGSSQALGLIPGTIGDYVRRAFYARTLARCAPTWLA